VIWDGIVETFDLALNPRAKRCYAWCYEDNGETQYVTILGVPRVDSAEMAVKTFIASRIQR
jgi:hypothetical protein